MPLTGGGSNRHINGVEIDKAGRTKQVSATHQTLGYIELIDPPGSSMRMWIVSSGTSGSLKYLDNLNAGIIFCPTLVNLLHYVVVDIGLGYIAINFIRCESGRQLTPGDELELWMGGTQIIIQVKQYMSIRMPLLLFHDRDPSPVRDRDPPPMPCPHHDHDHDRAPCRDLGLAPV